MVLVLSVSGRTIGLVLCSCVGNDLSVVPRPIRKCRVMLSLLLAHLVSVLVRVLVRGRKKVFVILSLRGVRCSMMTWWLPGLELCIMRLEVISPLTVRASVLGSRPSVCVSVWVASGRLRDLVWPTRASVCRLAGRSLPRVVNVRLICLDVTLSVCIRLMSLWTVLLCTGRFLCTFDCIWRRSFGGTAFFRPVCVRDVGLLLFGVSWLVGFGLLGVLSCCRGF